MLSLVLLSLVVASPCDTLIGELQTNDGVTLSWWVNEKGAQYECVVGARAGEHPELLRALDDVGTELIELPHPPPSRFVLSASIAAAQLRCDLGTSRQALELGISSHHRAVAPACIVSAATSDPVLILSAPLEKFELDDLKRAIVRLELLDPKARTKLGPLLDRAEKVDAKYKVGLMALLCHDNDKPRPEGTCERLAVLYPYRDEVGRKRITPDAEQGRSNSHDELYRRLAMTATVVAIDALLMTLTTVLRDTTVAGQLFTSISAGVGLVPAGVLIGALLGERADKGGFKGVIGPFVGAVAGAVIGAVLGWALGQTPGGSRPAIAGATLGLGTAVSLPLIWIF